jgi:hypothetical protein
MTIPKLYTAEYSISQDCFHIQELKGYIEYNIRCAAKKFSDDWRLVGLFEKEFDAHTYIESIRESIQGKEIADKFKQNETGNENNEEENF